MNDRITKGLLLLIAVGIWGLLLHRFIGPSASAISTAPGPNGWTHVYVTEGSDVYFLEDDGNSVTLISKTPLR